MTVSHIRRPVASLPGGWGWFVGGPKGDRVGWGGVCGCVGGGYYYIVSGRGGGGGRSNPPPLTTGLHTYAQREGTGEFPQS